MCCDIAQGDAFWSIKKLVTGHIYRAPSNHKSTQLDLLSQDVYQKVDAATLAVARLHVEEPDTAGAVEQNGPQLLAAELVRMFRALVRARRKLRSLSPTRLPKSRRRAAGDFVCHWESPADSGVLAIVAASLR